MVVLDEEFRICLLCSSFILSVGYGLSFYQNSYCQKWFLRFSLFEVCWLFLWGIFRLKLYLIIYSFVLFIITVALFGVASSLNVLEKNTINKIINILNCRKLYKQNISEFSRMSPNLDNLMVKTEHVIVWYK